MAHARFFQRLSQGFAQRAPRLALNALNLSIQAAIGVQLNRYMLVEKSRVSNKENALPEPTSAHTPKPNR